MSGSIPKSFAIVQHILKSGTDRIIGDKEVPGRQTLSGLQLPGALKVADETSIVDHYASAMPCRDVKLHHGKAHVKAKCILLFIRRQEQDCHYSSQPARKRKPKPL